MMADTQPWAALVRKMIESGPVSYDKVIAEAAQLVPPGRAYRDALASIESSRRRQHRSERKFTDAEGKKDQRIRYGQRQIVTSLVHSMVNRGRISVYERDGDKWLTTGPHPWSDPAPSRAGTPWSNAILSLVTDEPDDYEHLFEVVQSVIPRDKAIAQAIRARRSNRQGGVATPGVEQDDDRNFLVGARALFYRSVLTLHETGRVVLEGPRGARTVRRGPKWSPPRS